MPLDTAAAARVTALNTALKHHAAADVLHRAFKAAPNLALVSSFGAESVALLHLAATVRPDVQVLFIDTMLLFPETLTYQREVARKLGLRRVRVLRADTREADPDDTLHLRDPDACCSLRKTQVLEAALEGFDGWITGRKRFQSGTRAELPPFELEEATGRIKVNPLAHWSSADVQEYMAENALTLWSRVGIRRSAARPAPLPLQREKIPVPGAGVDRQRKNAASILWMAKW
jgi:phosphoadenosine phosphosulfate reductase